MSISIAHDAPAKVELSLKTWQIFLLILLANLLVSWVYNEFILTREVYHNLLSEQLEANRIDEYFDITRKLSIWGYLLQPLLFWLQIAFFALLIQTPLMLLFIEIPFRQVFRIVLVASLAVSALSVIQLLKLSFYAPSEITEAVLNVVPFSLTNFIDPADYPKTAFFVLNKFSLFELAWCVLLYRGLAATEKLKKDTAMFLVTGLWIALLLFQWAIVAYFAGVNG
ncbi:MAG: hypothetical protein ACE5I1_29125 [bacterium]